MLHVTGLNSSAGKDGMGKADGESYRGAQTWRIIAIPIAHVPGAVV